MINFKLRKNMASYKLLAVTSYGLNSFAFVLHIVGMFTVAWTDEDSGSKGLFRLCRMASCHRYHYKNDSIIASEASAVLGALSSGAGLLCLMFSLIPTFKELSGVRMKEKMLILTAASANFIATILIITTGLVWTANSSTFNADKGDQLGYSLYLSMFGAVFNAIASVCLFQHYCQSVIDSELRKNTMRHRSRGFLLGEDYFK